MISTNLPELRAFGQASLRAVRTAQRKGAALVDLQGTGGLTLQQADLFVLIAVDVEHAVQKRLSVRMLARLLQRFTFQQLHHPAEIHDGDALRDTADEGQIVTDENAADVLLLRQPDKQLRDLVLDRDVQRAGRLVAKQKVRMDRDRPRDRDALKLAAGELMRVASDEISGQAHLRQQHFCLFHSLRLRDAVEIAPRLAEIGADPHPGREGAERVLKHHLDPAPKRPLFLALQCGIIDPIQRHAAGGHRQGTDDHFRQRAFAAAALSDDPQHFTPRQAQADVADRMELPLFDRELLADVRYVQKNLVIWHSASLPASARRPAGRGYTVPSDGK